MPNHSILLTCVLSHAALLLLLQTWWVPTR
jgi:hypothetical protein